MPLMVQQGNGHIFVGSVTPTAVSTGDIWVDTSANPNVIKTWDGSTWASAVGSSSTITVGGISDTLNNWIIEAL